LRDSKNTPAVWKEQLHEIGELEKRSRTSRLMLIKVGLVAEGDLYGIERE
jgi:hypothetical protein